MTKIKVAIIVDNMKLAKWQSDALDYASDYLSIDLILNCKNTKNNNKYIKYFGYYLLNLFSLRNYLTKKLTILKNYKVINFESNFEGEWQRIPKDILTQAASRDIRVVIKFGMNLLKIDEDSSLDILSFHHGDPEEFRGRPAGFYELHSNSDRVGIVVQSLTNKLDAGKIFARAYCKIYHHSYRKTAINFYKISQYLLRRAIINYIDNNPIYLNNIGQIYRLPNNTTVFRFTLKLSFRKIRRLVYGAFYEKKWNIINFPNTDFEDSLRLSIKDGDIPLFGLEHCFYADPFFNSKGDKFFFEALNPLTGLGEIFQADYEKGNHIQRLLAGDGKHFSYPFVFADRDKEYMLPEVASHSSPFLLSEPFESSPKYFIEGLEELRLLDATLCIEDNVYYIFGGLKKSAADCLYLFFSDNLFGPYEHHPLNPIVIDPRSSRMGGRIIRLNGNLFRFGQNNCYGYGNGLTINKIKSLSKMVYCEEPTGSILYEDACGPHTIDIHGKSTLLDFYHDKFSLLAGYRRLVSAGISIIL